MVESLHHGGAMFRCPYSTARVFHPFWSLASTASLPSLPPLLFPRFNPFSSLTSTPSLEHHLPPLSSSLECSWLVNDLQLPLHHWNVHISSIIPLCNRQTSTALLTVDSTYLQLQFTVDSTDFQLLNSYNLANLQL
jgi:hypothetical protein